VRLDPLRAEGFAPADAFSGDRVGTSVTITVESPDRPSSRFTGKLIFVSPEVDPVNHQVRVLAEIENPDFALRPGLRGQMAIGVPDTSARSATNR
jgi:macrolide-specific efflux system membrane fusion protein